MIVWWWWCCWWCTEGWVKPLTLSTLVCSLSVYARTATVRTGGTAVWSPADGWLAARDDFCAVQMKKRNKQEKMLLLWCAKSNGTTKSVWERVREATRLTTDDDYYYCRLLPAAKANASKRARKWKVLFLDFTQRERSVVVYRVIIHGNKRGKWRQVYMMCVCWC